MANITLRAPTFSSAAASADFDSPTIPWLTETWHVTHSSLPMWQSKRNVRIQYTPLPPSNPSIPAQHTDRLDDTVTFQTLYHSKLQTVRGVDKCASAGDGRGEWDWRGKGWLVIAGSHWEVLGWGDEPDGNKWAVTCFAKTLFTPAGIDVYSKERAGVKRETLQGIKQALAASEDQAIRKMAAEMFEVKIDDMRGDE
ncbi:hypothetical protein EJ03DRAFT_270012 [Teratosphaeria nubilosa]|uniref:Uncharacterized protein n=1 Tax=Teratosphaeria nubilosa TaxID=161662 RepID=A0A6G1LDA9_9PEZI|nr:hypothetical protein EJ03DRAFT_270012 [Teratosphaeria nubilosa]